MKLSETVIRKNSHPSAEMRVKEINFVDSFGNVILKLNNVRSASITTNNGCFNDCFISASIDAGNMDVILPRTIDKIEERFVDMMESIYKEI